VCLVGTRRPTVSVIEQQFISFLKTLIIVTIIIIVIIHYESGWSCMVSIQTASLNNQLKNMSGAKIYEHGEVAKCLRCMSGFVIVPTDLLALLPSSIPAWSCDRRALRMKTFWKILRLNDCIQWGWWRSGLSYRFQAIYIVSVDSCSPLG
jgi:hypothetical protein